MKEQLMMILFVVLLGIAASAILVGTDVYTTDRISDNQEYALKSTILNAFGISYEDSQVLEIYEKEIMEKELDNLTFYYSKEGNIGFEFEGKGLWGPIEGFLTLRPDIKTIQGIQIIYHEETPGLGGVVAEQWYLDQYKGKTFDPVIKIKKDADKTSNTEVDAITGATMTSNAFEKMLNENYEFRKELIE